MATLDFPPTALEGASLCMSGRSTGVPSSSEDDNVFSSSGYSSPTTLRHQMYQFETVSPRSYCKPEDDYVFSSSGYSTPTTQRQHMQQFDTVFAKTRAWQNHAQKLQVPPPPAASGIPRSTQSKPRGKDKNPKSGKLIPSAAKNQGHVDAGKIVNGVVISYGSKNHRLGQCRPCQKCHTEEGCSRGIECNFCHYEHDDNKLAECRAFSQHSKRQKAMEKMLAKLRLEESSNTKTPYVLKHMQNPLTVAPQEETLLLPQFGMQFQRLSL